MNFFSSISNVTVSRIILMRFLTLGNDDHHHQQHHFNAGASKINEKNVNEINNRPLFRSPSRSLFVVNIASYYYYAVFFGYFLLRSVRRTRSLALYFTQCVFVSPFISLSISSVFYFQLNIEKLFL